MLIQVLFAMRDFNKARACSLSPSDREALEWLRDNGREVFADVHPNAHAPIDRALSVLDRLLSTKGTP